MALSSREKRILVVPVALGVIFAFYNWVHEPLFARKAVATEAHDTVSNDLVRSQKKLVSYGNVTIMKEAVTAREKVVDAWVPGKNSAALFIWYLSQAEHASGVHIKSVNVGEKKQVTANASQQQAPGAPAAPQDQSQNQNQNQGQQPPATEAVTLTVVQLNLKVEARFAQHLLFNQAIEEMPLFLNTDALAMVKSDKSPLAEAGKLVEEGNAVLAAQLLGASPNLSGTYTIHLYFKSDKVGPSTEPMSFAEQAGKTDPFAMSGVDEFLRALMQYYSGPVGPDGQRPIPDLDDLRGQLG